MTDLDKGGNWEPTENINNGPTLGWLRGTPRVVDDSLTTPVIYGGTAIAATLTLSSSSNAVPIGDFIKFQTRGIDRAWFLSIGPLLHADVKTRAFGGTSNYQAYNTTSYQNFIGYTRTSDDPTSGGAISGYLVAENDSSSGPQVAWGLYAEGRAGNFGFTAGAEIDTQNTSSVTARVVDPNNIFGSGAAPCSYAIWSQPDGTKAAVTPKDSSAWMGVTDNVTSGNKFLKGIVFKSTAIQTVAGHKEAINFGADQEIVWYAAGGATCRLSSDGNVLMVSTTTVAALPAAAAANIGARSFVTDSNAASFTAGIGAVVAAGGSTKVPVFSDGTNWRIG